MEALQTVKRAAVGAWNLSTPVFGVQQAYEGARTLAANVGAGGTYTGMAHGALKMGLGIAKVTPGLSTVQSAAAHVVDVGMHAYRDALDMSSPQITQTLNDRRADFTPAQWGAASNARRLYTFAKAAANLNPNVSEDVFRGGHLIVEDAGNFDQALRGAEMGGQYGGTRRGPAKPFYNLPSSHYPGHAAVQSELQMPSTREINFGTMLHGTTPGGHSWLQMEGHSGVWTGSGGVGRFALDAELHATDFLRHKATGRQIGPLGTSAVTEHAPLRVTAQHLATMDLGQAAAAAGRNRAARLGLPVDAQGRVI